MILLASLLGVTAAAGSARTAAAVRAPAVRDTGSDTWTATDALGRTLPGFRECGPPRRDRFVGIFYFLWLNGANAGLYDNSKLLAANPSNPQYGPVNAFHWWGEPRFGYYLSDDEWVIRKHAQMLSDAGVDVMIFDVTNAATYDDTYLAICRVLCDIRAHGGRTPQIAFITHSNTAATVQHLYDNFYSRKLYPELWFRWKGKPLLLASPDGLSPQLRSFFTLRESWAWSDPKGWFGDGHDKWPWLDNYPQRAGWHERPDLPEEVSVCVAQHPVSNIGRSYHDGHEPPPDRQQPAQGLCFAEQWRQALKIDPEFIFITGWNEWIAQRFISDGRGPQFLGHPLPPGGTFFVDEFDEEYSRDIEPMLGGHADDYYYQMVANIRRFKGVRPLPKASPPHRIRIDHDFRQWRLVRPEYRDDAGDTAPRNHPGWGHAGPYVNRSGRNDLVAMKVARDSTNLYFYVRTEAPITRFLAAGHSPSASPERKGSKTGGGLLTRSPDPSSNWMVLYLNTAGSARANWEGYDFRVSGVTPDGAHRWLERCTGGWHWKRVTEVPFAMRGTQMHLAIPRAALGLPAGHGPLSFSFKWADNVPDSGDILDFIDHGDVAPNGRFAYRYAE